MGLDALFAGLAGGLGGLGQGLQQRVEWQKQAEAEAENKRRWDAQQKMQQNQQDWERLQRGLEFDANVSQFEKQQAMGYRQMQQAADIERRRQQQEQFKLGVDNMRQGGAAAGVNYLNPERAYQMQRLMDQGVSMPTASGDSMQVMQRDPNYMQRVLKSVDATGRAAASGNLPGKMVQGSEPMGGMYVENRQYNPYTGGSRNVGTGGQNLTREVIRIKTEARRQADAQFSHEMKSLTQMQNQFSPQDVAAKQAEARKRADDAYRMALMAGTAALQQQFSTISPDLVRQMMEVQGMEGGGPPKITIPTRGGSAPTASLSFFPNVPQRGGSAPRQGGPYTISIPTRKP